MKKNVLVNLGANAWGALMGLAFVPFYVRILGIEAYGLIGAFAILQSMASLLDMGLSTTMNREMARLSTRPEDREEARNLARSLEFIYWAIALVIAVVAVLLAPMAARWLNTSQMPADAVHRSLYLLSIAMAFQWPFSLYSGGLMGCHQQVLLGGVNIVIATLRNTGALLILWLIAPTMEAFCFWQILVSLGATGGVAVLFWRRLRRVGHRPRFTPALLRGVWRFAAGVSTVSCIGLLLLQADKLILSSIVTLKEFGYYTLATVVSSSLQRLINPVYSSVFPTLTDLASRRDQPALRNYYHLASQAMAVLLVPAGIVASMFSWEILHAWTGDPETVSQTYRSLSLLVIGVTFQGLAHVPWAVQLAHGSTGLGLAVNLGSLAVQIPLLTAAAFLGGATGTAACYCAVNVAHALVLVGLMHRTLLQGEFRPWLIADVARPMLAAVLVALAGKVVMLQVSGRLATACVLIAVGAAAVVAVAGVSDRLRTGLSIRQLAPRWGAATTK